MAFLSEINTTTAEPCELSLSSAIPQSSSSLKDLLFGNSTNFLLRRRRRSARICHSRKRKRVLGSEKKSSIFEAKITKSDGTALTNLEKTGIINLPLQSLFSQIDVYMNGKCVTQNANNYPLESLSKSPVVQRHGSERVSSADPVVLPRQGRHGRRQCCRWKKYGSSDTLRLYAIVPHLRFRRTPVLGLFLSGQVPH